MKLLIIIIVTFFILNNKEPCASATQSIGARIIGGSVARSDQFPFMAAIDVLTEDSSFFCGGSLLNNEWILTSAVCIYESVSLNISLGSAILRGDDPNRVTLTASDIVVHPDFHTDALVNDIGLVRLAEPVEFSTYIQPIRLATINLPSILSPIALGWGQTRDDDNSLAEVLNYVNLSVLSNEDCRSFYGSYIQDTMVCVIGANHEGACYGDSGSPLVVRPIGASSLQVVGVSSFFSADGCENGNPSGYSRTYHYLDWINDVISAN